MSLITIDFETYYGKDYGLRKLTTEEYVRDGRFEIIGAAVAVDDGGPVWHTGGHESVIMQLINTYDWNNAFVLAHNTAFDGFIMSQHLNVRPLGWFDTLSMARALHGVDVGGSLAALAIRYGLGQKGTEVHDALGRRYRDFSATDLAQYGEYCKNDCRLAQKLFKKMVSGFPVKELKLIDATLWMFIHPVLELDRDLLAHHLAEVIREKARLLDGVGVGREGLMSNAKLAALLEACGVEPPTKISKTTGKTTYAFAKTDEGFKALAEHPDMWVQALVQARLGTKSTLEETRTKRLMDIADRGRLPIPLKYYGARTGRWAADQSINMQNVPRNSTIKEAIHAPEGYVIVSADLSNIELRVGLWLAGQRDKLALLGAGQDLYKDFASTVFNTPYADVTKEQRFIGKTAQLSLIYGTGAAKLHSAVKTMSDVDMGEEMAQQTVDAYRHTYWKVKEIWGAGTKALNLILHNEKGYIGDNDFALVDGQRGIMLPSGLYLQYNGLRKYSEDGRTKWDYAIRNGRDMLYGAKVFQGLTQAVARCIMGEHILAIQKRYKVCLTVHDAVYCVVPEGEAEEALAFVIDSMRVAPDWIPGIPLDAEGGFGWTLAG